MNGEKVAIAFELAEATLLIWRRDGRRPLESKVSLSALPKKEEKRRKTNTEAEGTSARREGLEGDRGVYSRNRSRSFSQSFACLPHQIFLSHL